MQDSFSLSPSRSASALMIPSIGALTGMQSLVKLPTINPVLQAAGFQTIAANPLNVAGSPSLPPPVPLLPPSLFGHAASLPELKNPLLSNFYQSKLYNDFNGDFRRGRHMNGLLMGEHMDGDRLKKALYRNDLMGQMDDNKMLTTFFGIAAIPFLCRGVWFSLKLSYH